MHEPDYNDPYPFMLKLSKDNHGKSMDMHDMVILMAETHSLFDKTFGVLTGKHRLSSQKRKDFQVVVTDIQQGSLMMYADIIVSGIHMALPMIGLANPFTVWEYTRSGFQLLKALYTVHSAENPESKKLPQLTLGDNNTVVIITGDNNQVTFPAPVLDIAARSRPNYQRMANLMTTDGISNFELNSQSVLKTESIKLSVIDQGLFESPTFINPAPVKVLADIYKFDKYTGAGKLSVLASDDVPKGEYAFSVIGEQDVTLYIDSMNEQRVSITALTENTLDPLRGKRITRLQIISIDLQKAS